MNTQNFKNNKGYRKLVTWKEAHKLVLKIYHFTEDFPKQEQFGLTSQIRRAVISVPTNIVEGQASSSKKDFLRFLIISNKSLAEVEYLLETAKDLSYLDEQRYKELEELRSKVGYLLYKFIQSLKDNK